MEPSGPVDNKASHCVMEMHPLLQQDQNAPPFGSETVARLLIEAIKNQDAEKVQSLLSKSQIDDALSYWVEHHWVESGIENHFLGTPLEYACEIATEKVFTTIMASMSGPEIKSKLSQLHTVDAPFHHTYINIKILEILLKMDEAVDINLRNKNDQTILHLASRDGHDEVVRLLLADNRIEINPLDCSKETPLYLAAYNGHVNIVLALLKHNAGIDQKSQYGMTPLLGAACKGNTEVLIKLLEYGADATACDEDGDTALHFLKRKCSPDVLIQLLRGGALLGKQNNIKITPISGIKPQTLQKVLDDSVLSEIIPDSQRRGKHVKDDKTLKFINPFATLDHLTNSDLKNFLAISNSKKHEHLVFHPLFKALIDMKWQVVQRLYFVRLSLFLVFVVCISSFIFLRKQLHSSQPKNTKMFVDKESNSTSSSEDYNAMNSPIIEEASTDTHFNLLILRIILWIFLLVLASFRILEFIFGWKYNYCNPFHLFESVLLAVIAWYLVRSNQEDLPPIILLLSWSLAFLHVSRYPLVSPLFYIFCYICKNFLIFFMFASLLLLGFLFTFYYLFKCANVLDEHCPTLYFNDPFKTAVSLASMMLGELGFSNLPWKIFSTWVPYVSLFIFFICFVLINMMNGLAVSDTRSLRKRAQFATAVAQGQMILSIEAEISYMWWSRLVHNFNILRVPKVSMFRILPSTGICMDAMPDKCIMGRRLNADIIDQATALTENVNSKISDLIELQSCLDDLRSKIERFSNETNTWYH